MAISVCYAVFYTVIYVKKVSEYDQEMPQSHSANQTMAPRVGFKERLHRHDTVT